MEDFVAVGRLVNEYNDEIKKVSPFRVFAYRSFLLKSWGYALFFTLFMGVAFGGGYLLGKLDAIYSWIFMIALAVAFLLAPIFIVRSSAKKGTKYGFVATMGRVQIELEYSYKLLKTAEEEIAKAGEDKEKIVALVWDKARAITYANGIAKDNLNLMSNNLIKIKDEKFVAGVRVVNELLNKIYLQTDKMLEEVASVIEDVDPNYTVNEDN